MEFISFINILINDLIKTVRKYSYLESFQIQTKAVIIIIINLIIRKSTTNKKLLFGIDFH